MLRDLLVVLAVMAVVIVPQLLPLLIVKDK